MNFELYITISKLDVSITSMSSCELIQYIHNSLRSLDVATSKPLEEIICIILLYHSSITRDSTHIVSRLNSLSEAKGIAFTNVTDNDIDAL